MKNFLLSILLLMNLTCLSQESKIEKFENYLGEEKVKCLNLAVESFDKFINKNFNGENKVDRYRSYLMFLMNSGSLNLETPQKKFLRNKITECGLKKDIMTTHPVMDTIIDYPSYNDKEDSLIGNYGPDTLYSFNNRGDFFQGLKRIEHEDTTLINYIDSREEIIDIYISSLAEGFLSNCSKDDYRNYFLKRVIVVELYLWPFIL